MLRTTTEAMAAVLGGCDVLTVRPYDAALRPAENFSNRIARNTQLILEHESHFDAVADPAAGSYYVETLTDKLARAAWAEFQSLDAEGGLLEGLQTGTVQSTLRESRDHLQQRVNDRSEVVVGTNHYPNLKETLLDNLDATDPEKTSPQAEGESSESHIPQTLSALQSAVADATTLAPVVDRLSQTAPNFDPLPTIRPSEELESLRLRTERHAKEQERTPVIFLAPLGPTGPRSARATFARNFFGVAGFEIIENIRFESPDAVVESAQEANADAVVLCSADREYPALAPALRSGLQSLDSPPLLVIAGNPENLDDVSADDFIHRGSPLLDTLERFQRRLGITAPSPR
jgi:methylmalonyl-CoA mutase